MAMSETYGINWGRWAVVAVGMVLVRVVLRGMSGALAIAGDEALYRAAEAADRIKLAR